MHNNKAKAIAPVFHTDNRREVNIFDTGNLPVT